MTWDQFDVGFVVGLWTGWLLAMALELVLQWCYGRRGNHHGKE